MGKSEFRSAGAASPRIDPGTLRELQPVVASLGPELWLIAVQADVLHYWIVQKGGESFQEKFADSGSYEFGPSS
jgi:hypothetical protein